MFKYTKRFASTIRFWWKEIKLRSAENAELDRISDITFQEGYGGHNSMESYGYYMTMQHNRKERKRIHEEEITKIN